MYSGIIDGHYPVCEINNQPGLLSFDVLFPESLLGGLQLGASVAIDGVCQTVSRIQGQQIGFDAMQETLDKTTLGQLSLGETVNVERSLRHGDENGGHELSGHIDGQLTIINVEHRPNNHIITLEVPSTFRRYVFNKGFLAVHGASLTVSDWDIATGQFNIYLIPETLRLTNLGQFKQGDSLNFEVERRTQVIVDTVERYLREHLYA
ncbi:riboflavin synthase subunit alpha [Celerinatantimonas yamalensis]|uniref:Riboflavin synthase n=1 Tax=Celerinatantimonas yamalensis TaxID=559956 RepID=A0ABW9G5Q2_9GAMM